MPCPNPTLCGSCGWSHLPYQQQLDQKIGDINGSFKLHEVDLAVKEIVPSPVIEHYRDRMDFAIDWQGNVGLREKGKWWRVIDNHPCFLADQQIDQLFAVARTWAKTCGLSFWDRKKYTGFLRYAVIRSTSLGETMLTIVTSAPATPEEQVSARTALEQLAAEGGTTTTIWAINHTDSDVSHGGENIILSGRGVITEQINGTRYEISPNAFFQTNPHGAALLLNTVQEFAGDLANKKVLDLYCGTGFFAVHLAQWAKQMTGVELVADAIEDAKRTAALNNRTITFTAAATEHYSWKELEPDLVIVDPPRVGLHNDALRDLITNAPREIIYISCNYKSFAREMQTLGEHYTVAKMRAVDMFPHTPHVELVTHLVHR
jgi:23S rRNA (uracil-5-)-methyltransferase RumA